MLAYVMYGPPKLCENNGSQGFDFKRLDRRVHRHESGETSHDSTLDLFVREGN
jgi:hypothetical protein